VPGTTRHPYNSRSRRSSRTRPRRDDRVCCASTPVTAIAESCAMTGRSTTTQRSSCSHAPPSATRGRRRRDRTERHDGRRVGAIRSELDAEGFEELPILAYARSSPQPSTDRFASGRLDALSGDRPATSSIRQTPARPARTELDRRGADIVMVKPALAYLDVIAACARDATAACGVQRQRRVCDGEGGCCERRFRGARRRARDAHAIRRAGLT